MARPKNADAEATKQALLRSAEAVFGAVGYHRARLEDIAAGAGIRRSSLLYYFASKERLYDAVVGDVTGVFREIVTAAIAPPGDAVVRVQRLANVLTELVEKRRAGISMFVRELLDSPPSGESHIGAFLSVIDMIEGFLRSEASHLVPENAPIRQILIHLFTSQALRAAAGELEALVWGHENDPRVLVGALLSQGGSR